MSNSNGRNGKFDEKILDTFLEQYQDFIKSVRLDDFNLDDQIRDYPSRKARFALALEKMRSRLTELKLEQKVTYYKLYKKYKQDAIEKGLKITEEGVKSLIFTDEEYIEVCKKVSEAEEKVGILQACKEALEDQGRMLFLLCENPERKW